MTILVHDFAGHAFPIQLSRGLAAKGHSVIHAFATGLQGPKGRLEPSPDDPPTLNITPVPLNRFFRKYSPFRRFISHRQYARDLKRLIGLNPEIDVVLSGQAPVDIQAELLWYCRRRNIGFVHWVQDVYCNAIAFVLEKKFGRVSKILSRPFIELEKLVASRSNHVVAIAPAFKDLMVNDWGVPSDSVTIIENWASLTEVEPLPRCNAWSSNYGLDDKITFLYSGTLGLKHRPDLLYSLSKSLASDNCFVVVISEGPGRDYLESKPPLSNLLLLDFQSYDKVPQALAAADVLLATLETDAAAFAVPSKILSYHCAARPILMAAPKANLAAAVIERSRGGLVADPCVEDDWLQKAHKLASDLKLRSELGRNARSYAETTFDLQSITAKFECILCQSSYAEQRGAPSVSSAVS